MAAVVIGGVGERFTRVGVFGFELSLDPAESAWNPLPIHPLAATVVLALLRSWGLFSEVGVSQLFESEKLLCCFLRNFSRLLCNLPSLGDSKFISESMGKLEGGSNGGRLSACVMEDL